MLLTKSIQQDERDSEKSRRNYALQEKESSPHFLLKNSLRRYSGLPINIQDNFFQTTPPFVLTQETIKIAARELARRLKTTIKRDHLSISNSVDFLLIPPDLWHCTTRSGDLIFQLSFFQLLKNSLDVFVEVFRSNYEKLTLDEKEREEKWKKMEEEREERWKTEERKRIECDIQQKLYLETRLTQIQQEFKEFEIQKQLEWERKVIESQEEIEKRQMLKQTELRQSLELEVKIKKQKLRQREAKIVNQEMMLQKAWEEYNKREIEKIEQIKAFQLIVEKIEKQNALLHLNQTPPPLSFPENKMKKRKISTNEFCDANKRKQPKNEVRPTLDFQRILDKKNQSEENKEEIQIPQDFFVRLEKKLQEVGFHSGGKVSIKYKQRKKEENQSDQKKVDKTVECYRFIWYSEQLSKRFGSNARYKKKQINLHNNPECLLWETQLRKFMNAWKDKTKNKNYSEH